MEQENSRLQYEQKRQAFYSDFLNQNKKYLGILRDEGGTFGHKEKWRFVSSHTATVADVAATLCELFDIEPRLRADIVAAGFLHDFDAKYEKTTLQSVYEDKNKKIDFEDVIKIKSRAKEILKKYKIPDSIVKLTEANMPIDDIGPVTLQEKIIWYADAIVKGSKVVSLEDRFEQTGDEFGGRNIAYWKAFEGKHGNHPDGKPKRHDEFQKEIGLKIEAEFAERLREKGFAGNPSEIPQFLLEKRRETIENFEPEKVKD